LPVAIRAGEADPHSSESRPIPFFKHRMSLWTTAPYNHNMSNLPASSTSNPLEMFTSCAISDVSVGDATIHTLYRPAQPGNDIVLVMIHGYPQTHVMWRSVQLVQASLTL